MSREVASGELVGELHTLAAMLARGLDARPSGVLRGALERAAAGRGASAELDAALLALDGAGPGADATMTRAAAAVWLARTNVWDGRDDLGLLRSDWGAMPPSVEANAGPAWARSLALSDATALELHTIDSADPHEVDDAIAAIDVAGATHLFVAIALPAVWVAPGDAADAFARRRSGTLYHPRLVAPMLDPDAVARRGSLVPLERREALVWELEVRADGGFEIVDVRAAWVQVRRAWTYDEAEHALAAGTAPEALSRAASALQRSELARVRAGGYLLYRDDVDLRAPQGAPVRVTAARQSARARRLVSEAMVLVGIAAARWCHHQGVAAPFRSHAFARTPPLPPGEYSDPWDLQQVLRCHGATGMATTARPHAGLGAAAGYVQAGSPLRRYGDLLAQHQILARLAGAPCPFDARSLTAALATGGDAAKELRAHTRRGKLQFALFALAERPDAGLLLGQCIGNEGSNARIEFPTWGVHGTAAARGVRPGAWVRAEVLAVEPLRGTLQVRVVASDDRADR